MSHKGWRVVKPQRNQYNILSKKKKQQKNKQKKKKKKRYLSLWVL